MAGFGSPNHFCDISRSSPQNLRLYHFCLQFWRLGWGSFGSAGFRKKCPVFQPVRAAAPIWKWVRRFLQTALLGGHSWLTLPHSRPWNLTARIFSPSPSMPCPVRRLLSAPQRTAVPHEQSRNDRPSLAVGAAQGRQQNRVAVLLRAPERCGKAELAVGGPRGAAVRHGRAHGAKTHQGAGARGHSGRPAAPHGPRDALCDCAGRAAAPALRGPGVAGFALCA